MRPRWARFSMGPAETETPAATRAAETAAMVVFMVGEMEEVRSGKIVLEVGTVVFIAREEDSAVYLPSH